MAALVPMGWACVGEGPPRGASLAGAALRPRGCALLRSVPALCCSRLSDWDGVWSVGIGLGWLCWATEGGWLNWRICSSTIILFTNADHRSDDWSPSASHAVACVWRVGVGWCVGRRRASRYVGGGCAGSACGGPRKLGGLAGRCSRRLRGEGALRLVVGLVWPS